MEYMAGMIDGAILIDRVIRNALGRTTDVGQFWTIYDAELTYIRDLLTQRRHDEVLSSLEGGV